MDIRSVLVVYETGNINTWKFSKTKLYTEKDN